MWQWQCSKLNWKFFQSLLLEGSTLYRPLYWPNLSQYSKDGAILFLYESDFSGWKDKNTEQKRNLLLRCTHCLMWGKSNNKIYTIKLCRKFSPSALLSQNSPLHEDSVLLCIPHCLDIQSLYVATSCVTLIIRPNILQTRKKTKPSPQLIFRHRKIQAMNVWDLDSETLPFCFVVRIIFSNWGNRMAQNNIGIIKSLLHLHGTIGTPPNVITLK